MDQCQQQLLNPNPLLYDDALWEVAKGHCSYFRTYQAFLVGFFTCILSALSSLVIIYIIMISSTRLSSIYHRIMLAMSSFDLIYSISGALGTLPMPAAGTDMWTDINNFEGPRIGNEFTCSAQGFLVEFGFEGFYCSYKCLLVYYVCSIGFKIADETVNRYLEPLFFIRSILWPLWITLPPLLNGDYNSSYDYPMCASTPKPWFCNNAENDGIECVRGKEAPKLRLEELKASKLYIISSLIVLFILTSYVFFSEWRRHQELNRPFVVKVIPIHFKRKSKYHVSQDRPSAGTSSSSKDDSQNDSKYEETKAITIQALWYAASLVALSVSWILLRDGENGSLYQFDMLYKSTLFALSYSQGLTNMLIFILHKVRNIKISNPDMSTRLAIMDVLTNGGVHDAIIITDLDVVADYDSVSHTEDEGDDDNVNVNKLNGNRTQLTEEPSIHFPQLYNTFQRSVNYDSLGMPESISRSSELSSLLSFSSSSNQHSNQHSNRHSNRYSRPT